MEGSSTGRSFADSKEWPGAIAGGGTPPPRGLPAAESVSSAASRCGGIAVLAPAAIGGQAVAAGKGAA